MPIPARAYIDAVITAALTIAVYAVVHWGAGSQGRFAVFVALFAGAALLKARIPGITGTYSPVFFFVLLGSQILSFSEVVFAAGLAGAVQSTFFVKRPPSPVQIAFNAANIMVSTALAFVFIHRDVPGLSGQPALITLFLGASLYYVVNTGLVSVVLTLVDRKPLVQVWRHWCMRSLPYSVFGAVIAGVALSARNQPSLLVVAMVCPFILLATLHYRYWLKSLTRVNALA
jgi:hypothetical protein